MGFTHFGPPLNPELDNLIPTILDQLQEIYGAIVPIKELGSQRASLNLLRQFQQRFQINN